MLQLQNISVGHGSHVLFSEITCALSGTDRRRIALLGDNGCGKTTFLQTILGDLPPLAGTITIQRERIVRVEQTQQFPAELVGEYLEGLLAEPWMEYRIPIVLAAVGLSEEVILLDASCLSGGQTMRLAFAVALLQEPTILLMDEPTNHLDEQGLLWLGNFIQHFEGSVLMITHDRAFITTYLQELWYLDLTHETLRTYRGKYTTFLEWKRQEEERLLHAYELLETQKMQLRKWLRAHESHPKYQFSSIVMAKKRRLAALERIQTIKPIASKTIRTRVPEGISKDQLLLKMHVNAHPYVRAAVVDLQVRAHDVIRITGPNGCGKSTILRLLAQVDYAEQAEIMWKEDIRIGYLSQSCSLALEKRVLTVAHDWLPHMEETQVRRILHQLGFFPEDCAHPVRSFSPGEQRKLELGLLLAQNPDLLLLDEPTNHMDITTREIIEEIIRQTTSAVIVISHDEFFCEQLGVVKEIHL